jgi:rubredoxin
LSKAIPLYLPALTGPTDAEVGIAEAVLAARRDAIKAQSREALIKCTSQMATGEGCGALHAIGTLEYIQTHWSEEPHGCSGGDRWYQGEGKWKCPSCGHVNRLYQSPEVTARKSSFASIVEEHER